MCMLNANKWYIYIYYQYIIYMNIPLLYIMDLIVGMFNFIYHIAPRAHRSNCAQGSSADLRPGLIRRSAPGLIRRTAPGRKWAHPASKYTWYIVYELHTLTYAWAESV